MDEQAIGVITRLRDHAVVKESPSVQLVVMDLFDELVDCLKKKTEKCKEAHTGYIIWKTRCLNYGQIIMSMRRKKLAAESK
jgi:hypothetical protein